MARPRKRMVESYSGLRSLRSGMGCHAFMSRSPGCCRRS
jgi:hypothetical protein